MAKSPPEPDVPVKPAAMHLKGSGIPTDTGKIHNGDAALALFDNLEDMHETFEPGEEKKLIGKTTIGWLIWVALRARIKPSWTLDLLLLDGLYNASFVIIQSILTGNIAGHTKKVISNAMIFLGVWAGNIAGPFFYKSDQAPVYSLGIWSMIVANFVEIALNRRAWPFARLGESTPG